MDFGISFKPRQCQFLNVLPFLLCFMSLQTNASVKGFDRFNLGDRPAFGPIVLVDSPDATFVEVLIQRGLTEQAIEYCQTRKQLAKDSQASADSVARWGMLLIHSMAAQAVSNEKAFDRPALLDAAFSRAAAVVAETPDSSRVGWLKYKLHWSRYFMLQRTLAAYLAVPSRIALREWSLQTLRTCLDDLDLLQIEVKNSPARRGGSAVKNNPPQDQWNHLENEILLLRAELLLIRGSFYPSKSSDKVGAAAELLDLLDKAASQINSDWPGHSRLELARCNALFMLGRSQESLDELQKLWTRLVDTPKSSSPAEERLLMRLGAFAAQVNRELGRLPESDGWIEKSGGPFRSPELALEHFANRLVIPSDSVKGPSTEMKTPAAQLQVAFELKAEIGNRFGAYWQQRADAMLIANKEEVAEDANGSIAMPPKTESITANPNLRVELLKTEAKQLLAADQWEKAVEKLNQAEMSAANGGQEVEALEIAMKAAAIQLSKGFADVARSEFFRSAIAYQKSAKAPDAALMSVWRIDRFANDESSAHSTAEPKANQQEQLAIYQGRLAEILVTWPNSTQAETATRKLEESYMAEDRILSVLELWNRRLEKLPDAFSAYDEATVSGPERVEWTVYDRAMARYALFAIATRSVWPDRTRYSDPETAALRMGLSELKGRLLERTPANSKSVAQAWLQTIDDCMQWPTQDFGTIVNLSQGQDLPLSLRTLGSEGQTFEPLKPGSLGAGDFISDLALQWARTEMRYQVQIRNSLDPKGLALLKREVERLQEWQTAETSDLSFFLGRRQADQLKKSIESYWIAISFWSGEETRTQALEKLAMLKKSNPKNPWWIYRSARLFQSDPSQYPQAIQQYRTLAGGFAAGSEAWLEMRARTVETMEQMGDSKSAQELANLVLATYPNIEDQWKRRFTR